jgi:hypothetical protein
MKLASTLAVSLALAASAVAAAPAAAFTPGPPFVMTGPVTIAGLSSIALTCTGTFNVQPSGPGAAIVSVTLAGSPLCSAFVPTGLPWPVTTTATTVTVSSVSLSTCGPGAITGTWNNASPGTLTFINALLPPTCRISASLSASPAQTLP